MRDDIGSQAFLSRDFVDDDEVDSIFVRDGQTYTSAGISAGIDLALAMIKKTTAGRSRSVACSLVVFQVPRRAVAPAHLQAQFSDSAI